MSTTCLHCPAEPCRALPLDSSTHHLPLVPSTCICQMLPLPTICLPTHIWQPPVASAAIHVRCPPFASVAFSLNSHCLPPAPTICLCRTPFTSATCHLTPPLTICLAPNTLMDDAHHLPLAPIICLWCPSFASGTHHLPLASGTHHSPLATHHSLVPPFKSTAHYLPPLPSALIASGAHHLPVPPTTCFRHRPLDSSTHLPLVPTIYIHCPPFASGTHQ